jgi:required for meiotic nuclear division protein 1
MEIKIEAYQVAESLNIKKLRADFKTELHAGNISELFYSFENDSRYLYLFDYGVVVFANYDEISKSEFLRFAKNYGEKWIDADYSEYYKITTEEKRDKHFVKNDSVVVPELTPSVCRIVMLNVGQSVALEFYETLADDLLNSTRLFTQELEFKGKLSTNKTQLLKFIGKALNVKNSIVDNLYILDDPNLVWDEPALDVLNKNLKTNFDTYTRFKDLDYRLQIVENNLKLFTEVLNHKEDKFLEWIVIILIAVEIINSFVFRH